MKAIQLTGFRRLEFVEMPMPQVKEGEALVKIEWISICASDIHGVYNKAHPEEEYPLAPGRPNHECAGTIVETKTSELKVGERVIVIPNQAAGGAQFVAQRADRIIKLPEWGSLDEWVMCQHTGTAFYSAKYWDNAAGKRIAILGQGGIGLSFTMFAEKQGALQVVAVDPLDFRLKKALELGATDTVDPSCENTIEAIQELTKGLGVDVVVDATGDPDALETAVNACNPGGQVISFSLTGGRPASFSHRTWMAKNLTLQGTLVATTKEPVNEIREIVALRDRGWIDPGKLKSHNWKWDRVQEAYEMYTERTDGVIKVALAVS